jgi:hypothetical protein
MGCIDLDASQVGVVGRRIDRAEVMEGRDGIEPRLQDRRVPERSP